MKLYLWLIFLATENLEAVSFRIVLTCILVQNYPVQVRSTSIFICVLFCYFQCGVFLCLYPGRHKLYVASMLVYVLNMLILIFSFGQQKSPVPSYTCAHANRKHSLRRVGLLFL